MRRIIKQYEEASGQLVNLKKSSVFFSSNTTEDTKVGIYMCLNNIKVVSQARYIGLPMVICRSKNQFFGFVKKKVIKKLQGWKSNLISPARKEVLLKAIAMALPVYTMSCFRISNSLCKIIGSQMAKFWWSSEDAYKKLQSMSWKKISRPKEQGELGFKDFCNHNTTLLAKPLWRIISVPNLMVNKVLKNKYFPKFFGSQC